MLSTTLYLLFIVRQDNQSEENLPNNLDIQQHFDQFPSEGQPFTGPFKVPNDVLKKQYAYGNQSRDLVIKPPINIFGQNINYSTNGDHLGIDKSKNQVKEKRKPTVSKNSKPKQQVIKNYLRSLSKKKKIGLY